MGSFIFLWGIVVGFLWDKFMLWRVYVGYVNLEVLFEYWVGNNGKGEVKDGDGIVNVGDVS